MKIAIATAQVPFIRGGAETLVEALRVELIKRSHQADIVTIPFKWYPSEALINAMVMGRMLDLTEVNGERIDLVIATKFPAYYLRHPNKVVWLFHQHRQAYDLWDTEYGDIHLWGDGHFVRDTIFRNDTQYLSEARRIFTIAENVTKRLRYFNKLEARTLYPPPQSYERLHSKGYEDFVFYPSRIDKMKRQRVLVEAARYLHSDTKIYIAGKGSQKETDYIKQLILKHELNGRVQLLGFIPNEGKIDYYSRCLAVYFGAYDEDYGYVTLEGFFSRKPVIVHKDAGGPLEFVVHGENGFVLDEDPVEVAAKIDELAENRHRAREMGERGYQSLREKRINWDYVMDNLLGQDRG